jgi:dienelactone hydrolase
VAAVAIYPWCDSVGRFFSPALIISAELDGIARPSSCERLVKSVPSGLNVPILKIMPGAYHWFDLPHRPDLTSDMTFSQTFDMTYEYNAKATEAAVNHVRSFLEANF